MLQNSIKGFVLRNAVLAISVVGLVVTRHQRNKARREARELRDELATTKVECVAQSHRAVRAEELNQTFAENARVLVSGNSDTTSDLVD